MRVNLFANFFYLTITVPSGTPQLDFRARKYTTPVVVSLVQIHISLFFQVILRTTSFGFNEISSVPPQLRALELSVQLNNVNATNVAANTNTNTFFMSLVFYVHMP
jgi:hypothetical protein